MMLENSCVDLITVNGETCLFTYLKFGKTYTPQNKKHVVSSQVEGTMLLFAQDMSSIIESKTEKLSRVEFVFDDRYYTLGEVLFTDVDMLPGYTNTDAAKIEFTAEQTDVVKEYRKL